MQTDYLENVNPVSAAPDGPVTRLEDVDERRSHGPGEPALVLGVGALLMLAGLRTRGMIWRALLTAAGTALVSRAASGSGGVARVARVVKRLR